MLDPNLLASMFKVGGQVLTEAVKEPPPPPQRADGYAIGGMLDGRSSNVLSSGATGGAYGGAFSQSYIDGSNWTVSTGRSNAVGGGTSGGNGGLAPTLTSSQGGIAPAAAAAVPNGPSPVFAGAAVASLFGGGNGLALLLGAGLIYMMLRR